MQKRQEQQAYSADQMLKRNAAFLIESSRSIDYDQECLLQMKEAFEGGEYSDVIDLAYIHDRAKRAHKQCCNKRTSVSDYVGNVISELSSKSQTVETPLQWCVSAIRLLSRDLTYENRELAKHEIRKAIHTLSES